MKPFLRFGLVNGVQISLETSHGGLREWENPKCRLGRMICLTVFALNRHSVFWMPLLYKCSLSGSVAVCREKRAWQLWPEVVVDFTISDKKPSAQWEHSTLLWWNRDGAAACCNKKHSQMFPLSTYFMKYNHLNRQALKNTNQCQ